MKSKHVLIVSKESYEYATEKVIDWLLYLGHTYDRLNGEAFEGFSNKVKVSLDNEMAIEIDNYRLQAYYNAIWFRRWSDYSFFDDIKKQHNEFNLSPDLFQNITNNLILNATSLKNVILKHISSKIKLTTIDQIGVNKLDVLTTAKKKGLYIPRSLITNSKKELIKFSKKIDGNLIVKSLDSTFSYAKGDVFYVGYTELISKSRISKISDLFFVSFFQEQIEKQYEVRIFFLNRKFYSMAIFSQKNALTQIDYRKYDFNKPNRVVAYNLPKSLEKSLKALMLELNLETGSIDMIKGKNGKYYFLEVNPVGQFSNLSAECNYNLENIIAKYLAK